MIAFRSLCLALRAIRHFKLRTSALANLPALSTLIAFEAAARRRSFALAASELNLTASAISHQIARLEEFLGTRLFDRSATGVRLSASGETYLQRVSGALGALSAATKDVRQGVRHSLYVHASPSFASLWLMPRLADFASRHPDISLSLSASHVHSDFTTGLVDLDIRYGVPRWPGLIVTPLFVEQVMPLASPALVSQLNLQGPRDVLAAPLIQSTVSVVQWTDWLAKQGLAESPEGFALRFDRAQLSLDAAVQGLGIALESTTIAAQIIASGALVPVFKEAQVMSIQGHFMVYPERHAKRSQVAAFLEWLRVEADEVQQVPGTVALA
jgi:DNA-binding transcriptional LysR family regulator